MEKLVCFILVNYNGYKDTLACVDSLLKIQYSNYKIIIIDNASTNNSVEMLKKIESERIKLISLSENIGFSGGNNVGIEIAKDENSDFIILLNNDTIVNSNFLKPLIDVCDENINSITSPKINYCSNKNKIWYAGGKISFKLGRSWHNGINKPDNNKNLNVKEVSFISGCCMCIPREVINKVGLLSEDYFLYYEDTDYCCKAMKKGVKLLYVPESLIYHNVSASTGHNSPIMTYYKIRNRLYFIEQNISNKNQIISKILFNIEVLAGLIIGKYKFSPVKLGIIDYRNKVMGKREGVLK